MNSALQRYREEQRRTRVDDRETLVQAYLPLVRRVAHRIARNLPASVELEDLVSAGCVGLLSAVERFDPERGLDFGLFAEFRIKGAILDELRALDPVPRRSRHRLHQFERARRELIGTLGRPPSEEEMAERLDLALGDYQQLAGRITPQVELSLSLLESENGELPLSAPDSAEQAPDAQLQRQELRRRLIQSIRRLPERLRTLVSLYYYTRLSYKEIALLFDVTESRVCQMHSDAIQRIRVFLETDDVGPAEPVATKPEPRPGCRSAVRLGA